MSQEFFEIVGTLFPLLFLNGLRFCGLDLACLADVDVHQHSTDTNA